MQLKQFSGDIEKLNTRRRDPRREKLQEWVKEAARLGTPQEITGLEKKDVDVIATRIRGYAKTLGYSADTGYNISVFRRLEVPSVVILIENVSTTKETEAPPTPTTTPTTVKKRPRRKEAA